MSLQRLIVLMGLGQSLYRKVLIEHLAAGAAKVVALVIITSMLAGATLIGLFYAMYLTALHFGVEPYMAVLSVSLVALAISVAFGIAAITCAMRLRDMPKRLLADHSLTHQVRDAAHGFIDGLFGRD